MSKPRPASTHWRVNDLIEETIETVHNKYKSKKPRGRISTKTASTAIAYRNGKVDTKAKPIKAITQSFNVPEDV